MTNITLIKCSRCGHIGLELDYAWGQRPEGRLCPACKLLVEWLEYFHPMRTVGNLAQLTKFQRFETRINTIIAH